MTINDTRVEVMLNHLKRLPEPEQSELRELIIAYGTTANRSSLGVSREPDNIPAFASITSFVDNLDQAGCRRFFAEASPAFVERHVKALTLIGRYQIEQSHNVLSE